MKQADLKFAMKFSKYRLLRNVKFRELEEMTGMRIPYLCDISKGKKKVSLDQALKISGALGFSLDDMKVVK